MLPTAYLNEVQLAQRATVTRGMTLEQKRQYDHEEYSKYVQAGAVVSGKTKKQYIAWLQEKRNTGRHKYSTSDPTGTAPRLAISNSTSRLPSSSVYPTLGSANPQPGLDAEFKDAYQEDAKEYGPVRRFGVGKAVTLAAGEDTFEDGFRLGPEGTADSVDDIADVLNGVQLSDDSSDDDRRGAIRRFAQGVGEEGLKRRNDGAHLEIKFRSLTTLPELLSQMQEQQRRIGKGTNQDLDDDVIYLKYALKALKRPNYRRLLRMAARAGLGRDANLDTSATIPSTAPDPGTNVFQSSTSGMLGGSNYPGLDSSLSSLDSNTTASPFGDASNAPPLRFSRGEAMPPPGFPGLGVLPGFPPLSSSPQISSGPASIIGRGAPRGLTFRGRSRTRGGMQRSEAILGPLFSPFPPLGGEPPSLSDRLRGALPQISSRTVPRHSGMGRSSPRYPLPPLTGAQELSNRISGSASTPTLPPLGIGTSRTDEMAEPGSSNIPARRMYSGDGDNTDFNGNSKRGRHSRNRGYYD